MELPYQNDPGTTTERRRKVIYSNFIKSDEVHSEKAQEKQQAQPSLFKIKIKDAISKERDWVL